MVRFPCLEIRSRNRQAITSTRNRIYSLKVFYFLFYRRWYFLSRVSDDRKYVCGRRLNTRRFKGIRALLSRSSGEMKFDSSSCILKPVYFAFVETMLQFFLKNTHFVKSRAHSPRLTSKIIAMIALRRAILMKENPVVSLHAHRLFSGRACSCKKDPWTCTSLWF